MRKKVTVVGAGFVGSTAALELAENKILPCTVYLEGEYGINNLFMGVPAKLGINGVKEIIVLRLNDEEMKEMKVSADAVKRVVYNMEKMLRANNR